MAAFKMEDAAVSFWGAISALVGRIISWPFRQARAYLYDYWLPETSIFGRVYQLLWLFALVNAAIFAAKYYNHENGGKWHFDVPTVAVGTITLFQAYFIYRDLHAIEDKGHEKISEMKGLYGPWIDAGMERFLRGIIVFMLIFLVGKVVSVLIPLMSTIYETIQPLSHSVMPLINFDDLERSDYMKQNIFLGGSVAAFLFLAIWNFIAAGILCSTPAEDWYWVGKLSSDRLFVFSTRVRLIAFGVSMASSGVYWALVANWKQLIHDASLVIIPLYLVGLITTVLTRVYSESEVRKLAEQEEAARRDQAFATVNQLTAK